MGLPVRILTAALIITCYLSIHGLVLAYSSGAGVQACETLMPLHFGATPQTTFSPYRITAHSNRYSPNNLVLVTLSQNPNPNAPTATTFRGILLQARADGSSSAVGSWLIQPDSEYSHRVGCPEPSSPLGSLTHNSGSDKSVLQPIEFDWIAPQNNVGSIRFFATVVQELNTFWVELTSSEVLTYFNSGVTFTDCPTTVNAFIPDGLTETTVIWTVPSAVDMSGNTVSLQSTHNPGDTFLIGTTPVTYSYVDGNGETFMCMFIVEVIVDTTPPTITSCPLQDVRVFINALDGENPRAWTIPQAMDNSNSPVVVTDNQAPGTTYPIGFYDVVYTFTDGFGNFATCEFTFVVAWQSDSQAPLIDSCPGPISVTSVGATVVTWVPPTATDDAGPVRFTTSHNPGDTFEVGVTDVTYTFEDTFLRTTSCGFSVTVVSGVDTTPPTITNCPSTIVRTTSLTSGFEMVTWNELVVEDPSQPVTRIEGPGGFGGFFSVGSTTTVIYAYQDSAGNIGRCTFDVTVTSSAVAVVCPATVAGTTTGQVESTLVFDNQVSCTANGASIMCTPPSGSFFSVGSTPVTCICTDGDGNTDSCGFNAVVTNEGADNIPPVVENCPGDFFRTVTTTAPFAEVSWDPLIVTDNSGQTPTMVNGPINNFGFYEQGTNPVIYIFSDASGNEVRCEFTVEVTLVGGDANPQIVCPSVIVGNTPANQAGTALIFDNQVTCTDDNAVQSVLCTPASGSFFSIGTTSISCTCTDNAGNIDTCVFDGIVSVSGDNTPPVVQNCPTGGVSATAEPNLAGGFATWGPIIVTDDSGQTPSVASQFSSGDFFAIGMTSVLITYSDAAGNSVSCAFEVTITDVTPPTINNCPSPIVDVIPVGATTLQVTWTPPTATDNSQQTVSVTLDGGNVGDQFSAGQTVVRYTFNDASMNEAICDVVILLTLGINNPPVITCPQSFSVTSSTGNTGGLASWDPPTCVDQEDGNIILTNAACNPASQAFFQGTGINEVTCSCTDSQLITTQCTFFVTVEGQNNAPVITCPGDVSVVSLANNVGNFASWDIPTCVDIEDGNIVLDQSACVPQSGGFFPNIGSSPVTCTCTDSGQLQSQCTFNVFVSGQNNAPVITCPGDVSVVSLANNVGNFASWDIPTCVDIEDGNVVLDQSACVPQSGGFFPNIGSSPVTCTCTDSGQLQSQCTFNVFVSGQNNAPVITCPGDVSVVSLANNVGNFASWDIPTCVDIEDGNIVLDQSACVPQSGGFFPNIGSSPVTCTCTDSGQLQSQCTFNVFVSGINNPPVITCPQSFSVTSLMGNIGGLASWDPPTCVDQEDGNIILTNAACNPASQAFFQGTGINEVTCSCTDSQLITTPCTFFVTVEGQNNAPVITCPGDVSVVSLANNVGNFASWDIPTCVDIEDGNIVLDQSACVPQSGGFFPNIGSSPVTCTCTDSGQLQSQCTFNVFVSGINNPPVITCPQSFSVTSLTGNIGGLASWDPPTCVDQEDGNIILTNAACNPASQAFFQGTGINEVTCSCTDSQLITTPCTFFVTVEAFDNVMPEIQNCPMDIVVNAPVNGNTQVVTWPEIIATDNSPTGTILTSTSTSGSEFAIGTTTVVVTAVDVNGNSDTCTFNVIVNDVTPPIITDCPENAIINPAPLGQTSAPVVWTEPTATDNSGSTVTVSQTGGNVGDNFPVNVPTTITYTFTDAAQNPSVCSFIVFVTASTDNEPPVFINCAPPPTVTVDADPNSNGANVVLPSIFATDNSQATPTITYSIQSGEFFTIGSSTVAVNAEDAAGNMATPCVITVVVRDVTPPIITDCPENSVTETAPLGQTSATVVWTEPTATDNSGSTVTVSQTGGNVGDNFPVNVPTTITYTFTDAAENPSVCSFVVLVTASTDNEPPVFINCAPPPTVTVDADPNNNGAVVVLPSIFATDNSQATPTITYSIQSGEFFTIGSSTVAVNAEDAAGNIAIPCVITVVVRDVTPPTIVDCPENAVIVSAPLGQTSATVVWTEPTATDNSGSTVTVSQTGGNVGDNFPVNVPTTITYTFTDAAQNPSVCSFIVFVTASTDNEPPVFINCAPPPTVTVDADPNSNGANVVLPSIFATDNSQATPTITYSIQSGEFFTIGSSTVAVNAEDAAGNTAIPCVITVVVRDVTPPTIIDCPENSVTVTAPLGQTSATVVWTEPTATDNSGSTVTVSQTGGNVGDNFPVNVPTTITYTFTDAAQNPSVCSFIVFVTASTDNEPPVFTNCAPPPTVTVDADPNSNGAIVVLPTIIATDNSQATPTITYSIQSGEFFTIGSSTVAVNAEDDAGNMAIPCVITVVVRDVTPPSIIDCPENAVIVSAPLGQTSATVVWTEPTATDNSGSTVTVSQTGGNVGDNFPVNVPTTITYTFTDAAQNPSVCSFIVFVTASTDNEPPVFTNCAPPPTVTVDADPNSNGAIVVLPTIIATDNSQATPTITYSIQSGEFFTIGSSTVAVNAEDDAGNMAIPCVITVVVRDVTPPSIIDCPENAVIVSAPLGQTSATVVWTEPTATDNSGSTVTVSQTGGNVGDNFPVNVPTTITYTFTDAAQNPSVCSFIVFVTASTDNEPPVFINCAPPPTVTVDADPSSNGANVVLPSIFATDNSQATPTITYSIQSGEFFTIGSSTVAVNAEDDAGNMAIPCVITVVVRDVTPPSIIDCPENSVTVTAPLGQTSATVVWTEPTATDNSGSTVTVSQTGGNVGDNFPVNVPTTITYTFTDAAQNPSVCSFIVLVTASTDNEPPVFINCAPPPTVEVDADPNSNGAVVVLPSIIATDNSQATPTITYSIQSGEFFTIGSSTVAVNAEDDAGNMAIPCVITVVVRDVTPPTIVDCPENAVIVSAPLGQTSATVVWTEPTATDNSGSTVTVSQTGGNVGDNFPVNVPTTITYTFTDAAQNPSVCSFIVFVTASTDNEPPVFINCAPPPTVEVDADPNSNGAVVVLPSIIATDNSQATPTITYSIQSGEFFTIGSSTVAVNAEDDAGNMAIPCVITVVVRDVTPPTIVDCPENAVIVSAPLGQTSATVVWTEPTATDNSGSTVTVSQTGGNVGDNFPVNVPTTITYTFTDAAQNPSVCSFIVFVTASTDNEPPVFINCAPPPTVTVDADPNSNGAVVVLPSIIATDNSQATPTITYSIQSGEFFTIGSSTVAVNAEDDAGNMAIPCVITVVVRDVTPPTIVDCPENAVIVSAPLGQTSATVVWTEPTATDNSGSTVTVSQTGGNVGDNFPVNVPTTITYTFTDAAQNPSVCSFIVFVTASTDNEPPVFINCAPPPTVEVDADPNSNGAVVVLPSIIATDNSQATPTITYSIQSGEFFTIGSSTVTVNAEDDAGNMAIPCVITVVVRDVTPPTIIDCPETVISVTAPLGQTSATVVWIEPTATDNSGSTVTVSQTGGNVGDNFPVNVPTTITYTFTDAAQNPSVCSFVVFVTGQNNAPVITCPGDVSVVSLANNVGNFASWDIPTCVDIEDGNIVLDQSACVPQSGGFFSNIGSSPVTCTCTDSGQLQSQCTFNVFVSDPSEIVSCQTDITETVLTGSGGSIVTYQEPVLDLGSGTFVLVSSPTLPSGAFFPIGQTVMQYIYSDGINQLDCTFTITVLEDALCNSDPCLNGAVCLDLSLTDFFCVCSGCFEGQLCQIEIDPCVGNQCGNGGVCIRDPTSCTQYWCQCSSCFTGQFCQIGLDACRSHQCQNGAMCVPDPVECDLYTCQCTGCFQGDFCQTAFDPCTAAPCQNNAICTNVADSCSAYSCQCIGCFTGFNCEEAIPSPCAVNPCLNSGICLPVVNSCTAQTCLCPPSFGGAFCENAIVSQDNPCNNNPCLNYGTCASYGSEYKCYCRPGFSGINCQFSTAVVSGISSCDNMPCLNNGVCYNSYVTTSSSVVYIAQYTCVCPVGFTGQNCALLTLNNPGQDACATNAAGVCQNGGTCRNSYCSFDQTLDYFCECPIGFTGQFCDIPFDDPCQPNPCANTAQCTSFNTYFVCTCVGGFTGRTCEVPPEDDTSPIVSSCPTQPIVVVAEPGETFAVVSWTVPTAVDDSGDPVVVASVNSAPGARYNVNTLQTVIYMFADSNGNIEVCMFDIQVLPASTDTEDPVLTFCPGNIIEEVAVGSQTGTVTWTEPTATDNSGTVIPSSDFSSPLVLNVGDSQTVTYRLSDPSGNFVECIFMVSVVEQFAIACPPDQTLFADAGNTAVAAWPDPVTTNSNLPVFISCSPQEGTLLEIGNEIVTCLATDTIRSDSCTFNVVVVSSDNDGPVLTCPGDIVRVISTSQATASIDWNEPTAVDASPPVTLMANLDPPLLVAQGSSTSIMYTGTDALGNMGSCSFTITVIDDTADPELICPPSQNLFIQSSGDELVVTWDAATVVDNVDNNIIPNPTILPGTRFSEGTNGITYIAVDSSGNFGTCSFTVTVSVDSDLPVISGCPSDQTVTDPSGSAAVSWVEPTVTDATSMVTLTSTEQSGDTFSGSTTVTYTAVDEAGNTASCTFSVTVNTVAGCESTVCPAGEFCVEVPPTGITMCVEQGRRKRELLSIEVEEDINAERANKMFLPAVASLLVALSLSVFAVIFIRRYRTNYIRTDEVVNIQ
ncbi:uncharacterized protein [Apostichopus japonicus]|uniref:uncharacterized protein isoform X6 n=1 Tax=Stichopus japonicus TaxID=307972 RepID=UPI003AB90959